jgi:methionine aminopeptidase
LSPASVCISINEEIIHGIPSARALREGDLVSLDFGVSYDGFYGDAARSYPVGRVSLLAERLMATAEAAFHKGVERMVEGGRVSAGVRNFRFNQSVLEMLSNVELLGPAVRAAGEESFEMAVSAMKVRDFHFSVVTKF